MQRASLLPVGPDAFHCTKEGTGHYKKKISDMCKTERRVHRIIGPTGCGRQMQELSAARASALHLPGLGALPKEKRMIKEGASEGMNVSEMKWQSNVVALYIYICIYR